MLKQLKISWSLLKHSNKLEQLSKDSDLVFQETGKDNHVHYLGSYQTEKNVR